MVTLAFLEPGHFHAALTLRRAHPAVSPAVRVYARPGPDLDGFLALVDAFNQRPEEPTAWQPEVFRGEAPLEQLLADGQADAVVLAGRNDTKMATVARLHVAGLPVLADKPWVAGPESLPELRAATDGEAPLVADIMTAQHEDASRVARRVLAEPDVFGGFVAEADGPAIVLETIHHLAKRVNGLPLVRPPWYFDVDVQGNGIVDVPSHQAHLAQWLVGVATGEAGFDYDRDVRLDAARLWDTAVPAQRYREITDASAASPWPPELAPRVRDNALALACNGEIAYRLRGVSVRVRSEWHLDEPPGGCDIHRMRLRGTRADFLAALGPETGFRHRMAVRPRRGQAGVLPALERAVAAWQAELPGVSLRRADDWPASVPGSLPGDVHDPEAGDETWEVLFPLALRTTHEQHFALTLEAFLARLGTATATGDAATADWAPGDLRCKYTLLARAAEMAASQRPPAGGGA